MQIKGQLQSRGGPEYMERGAYEQGTCIAYKKGSPGMPEEHCCQPSRHSATIPFSPSLAQMCPADCTRAHCP